MRKNYFSLDSNKKKKHNSMLKHSRENLLKKEYSSVKKVHKYYYLKHIFIADHDVMNRTSDVRKGFNVIL